MGGRHGFDAVFCRGFFHDGHFGARVVGEAVHGHHRLQAELLEVGDVPRQVRRPGSHRVRRWRGQIGLRHAAVHLQRPHGADQHHGIRAQAGLAALDVEELLRAEIGPEARFRDHDVRQAQGGAGGHHGVAAVGDVGEGAAVNQSRIAFQRLHQIRLHGVAQQRRQGTFGTEIAGFHRRAVAATAHHQIADAPLQVRMVRR